MKDRILAVFSVLNDKAVTIAQLVLRADGELDGFGDPSATVDALALLLRVGPAKLQSLTHCPFCGCVNMPDHLKCDDCGQTFPPR